jgi:hypothetical protein
LLFVLGAVALDVAELFLLSFELAVRAEIGLFAQWVDCGCIRCRLREGDLFTVVEVK